MSRRKEGEYKTNDYEWSLMWKFYWKVWNGENHIKNFYEESVYKRISKKRWEEKFYPVKLIERKLKHIEEIYEKYTRHVS